MTVHEWFIGWKEILILLGRDGRDIDWASNVVYGVPKGGMIIAGFLKQARNTFDIQEANIILDDIIDSGNTKRQYESKWPDKKFVALFDKRKLKTNDWLVMPWESEHPNKQKDTIQENIVRQLQHIGEDPNREGLKETPDRIVRAWDELFAGYNKDPAKLLTTFSTDGYSQIVLSKDIEIYSMCLAGSTFIETPRGRIPINRINHDDWVYCWEEEANKMTLARAQNPRITGQNKQLWRVYSDKDTVLCTGDHKFLTYKRGWVKAKGLIPGDSIVALNKGVIVENGKAHTYLSRQHWEGEGKQIAEHRFVFSEIYGEINTKDHIHHMNDQPNDNAPSNLERLSLQVHSKLHRKKEEKTGFALFSDEQRQEMKQKQVEGIKRSQTAQVKKQRSESLKKYWASLSKEEKQDRNHKILLVEQTNWFEDVWNMDIPKYHNFIANGMVVHNCEHHILPFFGKAHVAYIPDERVIGISKLARLVDIYARRLQIQERLGEQVTNALMEHLKPQGAACIIEAQHLCMMMRGCSKQNSVMITSSLKGVFMDSAARQELMDLIH